MAQVRRVVHRGPTDVPAHAVACQRRERLLGARERVEQLQALRQPGAGPRRRRVRGPPRRGDAARAASRPGRRQASRLVTHRGAPRRPCAADLRMCAVVPFVVGGGGGPSGGGTPAGVGPKHPRLPLPRHPARAPPGQKQRTAGQALRVGGRAAARGGLGAPWRSTHPAPRWAAATLPALGLRRRSGRLAGSAARGCVAAGVAPRHGRSRRAPHADARFVAQHGARRAAVRRCCCLPLPRQQPLKRCAAAARAP